ncbi:hypothetical protein Taro_031666 [Colocasia esculenta]|uniref:Uncharacterized protein n=1 Tax=Colocasia esculenta TaxID=4460 RepID=A0A843VZM7_COLES|nr:hypothetical protein [Colocasia esculenta]
MRESSIDENYRSLYIKRRVTGDSNSCTTRTIGVGSQVLGYNQLIDHVGIHGQRRLTEALIKDSLVRQKEYPTESSSKSREGGQNAIGFPSRLDHDRYLCRDGPENAAYRAVAFAGSEPEFEREKDRASGCGPT